MMNTTIPVGHQQIMPYMIVNGAESLIRFLERVFMAKEVSMISRSPGVIAHAEIRIGNATLILADASEEFHVVNSSMYVYVDDVEATHRKAITHGSISLMEPEDQIHGVRSSGFLDPYGNTWWIAEITS